LVNNYRVGYETPFVFFENAVQTDGYTRSRTLTNTFSDYYVEKASFTRLQFATIAYTFDFAENSPLKSLRLSLTGNNLITFTKYQGADPEARYEYQNIYHESPPIRPGRSNPFLPGVDDFNTWLPARAVVFGISAVFQQQTK
jgi:iron complex outermembrane receptor protein